MNEEMVEEQSYLNTKVLEGKGNNIIAFLIARCIVLVNFHELHYKGEASDVRL